MAPNKTAPSLSTDICVGSKLLHAHHGWGTVTEVDDLGRLHIHFTGGAYKFGTYSRASFNRMLHQVDSGIPRTSSSPVDIIVLPQFVMNNPAIWSLRSPFPDWSEIASTIRNDHEEHENMLDNLSNRAKLDIQGGSSLIERNGLKTPKDISDFILRQCDIAMRKFLKEYTNKAVYSRNLTELNEFLDTPTAWLCEPKMDATKSHKYGPDLDFCVGDVIVTLLTKSVDPDTFSDCVRGMNKALDVHILNVFGKRVEDLRDKTAIKIQKKELELAETA